MIKSLLDRFERNGLRRISSWILALFIAGWLATASAIYKGLWLEGLAVIPDPSHLDLLYREFYMILTFYIARTIFPLAMRILAVWILREDTEKLLTATPDPDPIEDPPSLSHIDTLLTQYKQYHRSTPYTPPVDDDS